MRDMNQKYMTEVLNYKKNDAIIAFLVFACYVIVMVASGLANLFFGLSMMGSWLNLVVIVALLLLVLLRKERLSSIGIGGENLVKALCLGLLCGAISIVVQGIVPLINGCAFAPLNQIMNRFIYQLVFIALAEEIVFRGYIQTRLYGMIKGEIPAIMTGALLFSVMHLPYMFILNGVAELLTLQTLILLAFWFAMHIILNFVYRRTGSIFGVVLFHALYNTANNIFSDVDTMLFGFDFSYITHGAIPVLLAIAFLIIESKTSSSPCCKEHDIS